MKVSGMLAVALAIGGVALAQNGVVTTKEGAADDLRHRASDANYYINVNGNTVHRPTFDSEMLRGATAQCKDGSYSFSRHRRGTCSYHGGVALWL